MPYVEDEWRRRSSSWVAKVTRSGLFRPMTYNASRLLLITLSIYTKDKVDSCYPPAPITYSSSHFDSETPETFSSYPSTITNMFRKKTSAASTNSRTLASSDSIHAREALTTPHPNSRSAGVPRPDRRLPKEAIGINRLLETYDEFAHLTQVVASQEAELASERNRAEEAEDAKAALEIELRDEREGRKSDGVKAGKDLKAAEVEREKKIRGDLEPKIKDLQERLKKVELERDGLKKEVQEKVVGMNKWIAAMEKLNKSRAEAENRERVAAEERKKLDEKLKELDGEILTGMKGWAKKEGDEDKEVVNGSEIKEAEQEKEKEEEAVVPKRNRPSPWA